MSIPEKYSHINFKPTQSMSNNAKRALEAREKKPPSQRGMTAVGLARARQLINREELSPDIVRRMLSYFQRHEVDKQGSTWKEQGKGWQAWMAWGGDEGYTWSRKIVSQMDQADEESAKGGDNNLNLEHKQFDVVVSDVKMEGDKGKATILLSPFDNVDLGNDRVRPSVSNRNNGKKVPLLKQHSVGTEHGHMDLFTDNQGIKANVTLYLEKTEEGQPIFTEAYRHYALLKRAESDGIPVKYSIGYRTLDYKYVTEGKQTVRDLIDIDIMEGSRVTFPMNPKASNIPGSVKALEGGETVEFEIGQKAFSFNQVMEMEDLRRMRYKVREALDSSISSIMNDSEMNNIQKVAAIDTTLTEFHGVCLEMYKRMLDMKEKQEKELDATELVEKSSSIFMHEIKAGASISQTNRDRLQSVMKALSEVMGCNWDKIQKAMLGDMTEDEEGQKSDEEISLQFKSLIDQFKIN